MIDPTNAEHVIEMLRAACSVAAETIRADAERLQELNDYTSEDADCQSRTMSQIHAALAASERRTAMSEEEILSEQAKPEYLEPWVCPKCGVDCSGTESPYTTECGDCVGYRLRCRGCGCEFLHWEKETRTAYGVEVDAHTYEYPQDDEAATPAPAESILALMEASWPWHGEAGEPYSDVAAAEIAINELIDYVRDQGATVTWDNHEIGSPYGVVVRPSAGE